MSNKKFYKETFDTYYETAIEDFPTSSFRNDKEKSNTFRRLSFACVSLLSMFIGVTAISVAAGWIDISQIFSNIFNDSVSGNLVESGIVQELDVVNETEDFRIKLSAFTGDMDTPVALFELTPKNKSGNIDKIILLGQDLDPPALENYGLFDYPINELEGVYDKETNTYYFTFRLGSYLMNDYYDESTIRLLGAKVHDGSGIKEVDFNVDFTFLKDKSLLENPYTTEVNQLFAKDIYESISFIDEEEYDNPYLHKEKVNALTKEISIRITDMQVSNYKTAMNGFIMDDTLSEESLPSPSSIRNQFVVPEFVTNHYWNGLEDKEAFQMALVDNKQRIRLYVDDKEMALHEKTLDDVPYDINADGLYSVYMEFDGFDYESANKVEVHFGDEVISIK